jgi:adenylate kinase family enzyme
MLSPEVILLGGAPGSGKSSIAKKAVELANNQSVSHLSIGDLKRSIVAGERPSAYAELLQQRANNRKSGAAPSEAMTGIMEEFIQSSPLDGLTIIDGFPRYMDRVVPFKESMQQIGANVLALCVVKVDEAVLIDRLTNRPQRSLQKLHDPQERIDDHKHNIVPTLELLAQSYPSYVLDGELPIETNAEAILGIYLQHTSHSG